MTSRLTGNVLVFDSGMGGLTVARELQALAPTLAVNYAADSGFFPYGDKSDADLRARLPLVAKALCQVARPDVFVIACNTASTLALEEVRDALDIPVVGTVPAIKPAAVITRSGTIGLLATPGTVKRDYTANLIEDFASEARVIMLGFAHEAETLKYGRSAGQPNPFQDAHVRTAVARAVNEPAILQTIMRGNAEPASQLVSPAMRGYSTANSEPYAFDADGAKALLAEAGYPDGFSLGLKCPNNRYLNDEAVCQAVVGMLAQIGVEAQLDAMPVQNYWPELRADIFDTYLLGWSPGTFDAEHPMRFLASTPNEEKRLGSWNFGGYSNERIDELLPMIQSVIDDGARQAMLDEYASILQDEVGYVPMYVQPLVWGVRDNVDLTQRPDNFFILRWVTVN